MSFFVGVRWKRNWRLTFLARADCGSLDTRSVTTDKSLASS